LNDSRTLVLYKRQDTPVEDAAPAVDQGKKPAAGIGAFFKQSAAVASAAASLFSMGPPATVGTSSANTISNSKTGVVSDGCETDVLAEDDMVCLYVLRVTPRMNHNLT